MLFLFYAFLSVNVRHVEYTSISTNTLHNRLKFAHILGVNLKNQLKVFKWIWQVFNNVVVKRLSSKHQKSVNSPGLEVNPFRILDVLFLVNFLFEFIPCIFLISFSIWLQPDSRYFDRRLWRWANARKVARFKVAAFSFVNFRLACDYSRKACVWVLLIKVKCNNYKHQIFI